MTRTVRELREQKGYLRKEFRDYNELVNRIKEELNLFNTEERGKLKFRRAVIAVMVVNKLLSLIKNKVKESNKVVSKEERLKIVRRVIKGLPKMWSSEEELIAQTLHQLNDISKTQRIHTMKSVSLKIDKVKEKGYSNNKTDKNKFIKIIESIKEINKLKNQLKAHEQNILKELAEEANKHREEENRLRNELEQKELKIAEYEKVSKSLEPKERAIESLTTTIVLYNNTQ